MKDKIPKSSLELSMQKSSSSSSSDPGEHYDKEVKNLKWIKDHDYIFLIDENKKQAEKLVYLPSKSISERKSKWFRYDMVTVLYADVKGFALLTELRDADVLIDELGGVGGGTPNGDDIENYPLSDYSEDWAIIAPGGIETITLTGTGFMGYYIGGSHEYVIYVRSENEMTLRSIDGNDEFDWGFILIGE